MSYRWLCFFALLSLTFLGVEPARAQSNSQASVDRRLPDHHAVVNLWELSEKERLHPAPRKPFRVFPQKLKGWNQGPAWSALSPFEPLLPAVPAPQTALTPLPVLFQNFVALGDSIQSIPPDTHGAVGPDHIMVMLNDRMVVQNRSGANLMTPVNLDQFWASVGSPSTFDPKLIYDPYGQRWIITACANAASASSAILVGVSQTSNPTGNWNLYSYNHGSTNLWIDYPSIGFNKTWISIQVNMFTSAGSFQYSQIFILEKANLYANGTGVATRRTDPDSFTQVPATTFDANLSKLYLMMTNTNSVDLFSISGTVGNETYAYERSYNNGQTWQSWVSGDIGPQLGSSRKIAAGDDRMQSLVYRNGTLWASHAVFLPQGRSYRAAILWWQVNPTSNSILQSGMISDTSGNYMYAFPSLAVNKTDDAVLGYSRFSANEYASAAFSTRLASDAAGTMRSSTVLKAGEAPYFKTYGGTKNRWGDYSATSVDPANDSDIWTIQEYAWTKSGSYDRWGTWWGRVVLRDVPPVASNLVLSPASPKTASILSAQYSYVDEEAHPESGSLIRWYRNDVVQTALNNLSSVPAAATFKNDVWYFTVQPGDGIDLGTLKTSSTVTILNTAPDASNLGFSPSVISAGGTLTATYTFTDDDGDAESGSIIRWTLNGAPQPALNDLKIISTAGSVGGDSWQYTVRPRDGTDSGTLRTSPVKTVNLAPTATALAITPPYPTTITNLTASYTYTDLNSQTESGSQIRWYRDGDLQPIYNNLKTIPASATTRGDSWYFTVEPSDGYAFGATGTSSPVVVLNTLPVAAALGLSPTIASPGGTLTASYTYTDGDLDLETGSEIRWYQNTSLMSVLNNQTSISLVDSVGGDVWYFTVRPGDGVALGALQTSASKVVNSPPLVSGLAIQPTYPTTITNLTANYTYTDANSQAESGTKIRWYRGGVLQIAFNDLKTLPADATERGDLWQVTVEPSDGYTFGVLDTSTEIEILNSKPVAANLSLSPDTVDPAGTMTLAYDYSDADLDDETATEIRWYKNDDPQVLLDDQATVSVDGSVSGDVWVATVQPGDGIVLGSLVTSASRTINSPPDSTAVTITPVSPFSSQNLSAVYTFSDPNGQGESGTQIRWYRDGVTQTAYNDLKVVPSTAIAKGEQWYFTVIPSDGTLYGPMQISSTVTILNSPPNAAPLTMSPSGVVVPGASLTAGYTYSDTDQDPESGTQVKWYKNGALQSELNDQLTISTAGSVDGNTWYFTVLPHDGMVAGTLRTSTTLILNTAPSVTNLQLSPASPTTGVILTAAYTYSDVNGHAQGGTEIRWYKNGELQPLLNDLTTVPASATVKGEAWNFIVRPRDGYAFGATQTSVSRTIVNSAPASVGASLTPSAPYKTDALRCEMIDWNDADGDAPILTYIWKRNGTVSSSLTTEMLAGAVVRQTDSYSCQVQASDGSEFVQSPYSQTVTVANRKPGIPVVVNSKTVISVKNASDADGDILTYNFEVFRDEGLTDRIRDAQGVAQGTGETGLALSSGDEGPFYWRARTFDGFDFSEWTSVAVFQIPAEDSEATGPDPITTPSVKVSAEKTPGCGCDVGHSQGNPAGFAMLALAALLWRRRVQARIRNRQ